MTDLRDSRSVTSEEVLAFLSSKRNNRGLLKCDQKALAGEFGCDYTKFHRTVNQLLEDGLLKVVAIGSRGQKTYKVSDPVENNQGQSIS